MPDQILSFYIGIKHDIHDDNQHNHTQLNQTIPEHTILLKYTFKLLLYATGKENRLD